MGWDPSPCHVDPANLQDPEAQPDICWAKMGCKVLREPLKPAQCRALMTCLPSGMGRGPKRTLGSGVLTCTRAVLTPALQVWGLLGPWDPAGLETWAVSFSSELCMTLQALCLPSWREAPHARRAELGSGVLGHQLAYFYMGTLAVRGWGTPLAYQPRQDLRL